MLSAAKTHICKVTLYRSDTYIGSLKLLFLLNVVNEKRKQTATIKWNCELNTSFSFHWGIKLIWSQHTIWLLRATWKQRSGQSLPNFLRLTACLVQKHQNNSTEATKYTSKVAFAQSLTKVLRLQRTGSVRYMKQSRINSRNGLNLPPVVKCPGPWKKIWIETWVWIRILFMATFFYAADWSRDIFGSGRGVI